MKPDLGLLDIMVPQMGGSEVCQRMRSDADLRHITIICLTARSDEKTEVEGLDKGADDYITKRISTRKLISRIKAVMRRFDDTDSTVRVLRAHDLEIDRDRYIVSKGEEEFRLL